MGKGKATSCVQDWSDCPVVTYRPTYALGLGLRQMKEGMQVCDYRTAKHSASPQFFKSWFLIRKLRRRVHSTTTVKSLSGVVRAHYIRKPTKGTRHSITASSTANDVDVNSPQSCMLLHPT